MKILICSEDIPNPSLGGLGKHALNLAFELANRGHEVDILGNDRLNLTDCPNQQGPGRFFSELAGFDRGWKQKQFGVFHALVPFLNGRPVLAALLKHAPAYDVLHYHGHLPWIAAKIPPAVPFIQTRHDQGGDCLLKTRYLARGAVCAEVDPLACASCAAVYPNLLQKFVTEHGVQYMRKETEKGYRRHPTIFVSEFLKKNFEQISSGPIPGKVIHNAVDTKQLTSARSMRSKQQQEFTGTLNIFAAGALFAYKGFGPLLAAIRDQQVKTGRAINVRVAGSGPEEAKLRSQFASGWIEFLGWTSYPRVVEEVVVADVVLVPSVWEEPCATSILEALALGKAVYALKGGGTAELQSYAGSAGGRLYLFESMAELAAAALDAPLQRAGQQETIPIDFFGNISAMAANVEAEYIKMLGGRISTSG